jgi:hypothetical protein
MTLLGVLAGFALGAAVYAGIAVTIVRAVRAVPRALRRGVRPRAGRSKRKSPDRHISRMHRPGAAERALRRVA